MKTKLVMTRANPEEALIEGRHAPASRWRVAWPRQMTPDRISRRSQDEIMCDFYHTYRTKLTKWAKKLCHTWGVPVDLYEDCVQAALMQAHKCIPGWDPDKANMWTYSYLGLRKAMMCIIREYHHNPKYGHKPVKRFIDNIEDLTSHVNRTSSHLDEPLTIDEVGHQSSVNSLTMYDRIMVRRILQNRIRQDPRRMRRLVRFALEGETIAELARTHHKKITKQGFYNSILGARKLLAEDLEAYYER